MIFEKQIEELRAKGLLGSTEDPFWDPVQKKHTCCGSPRSYYHREGCPACREIDDDEIVPGYSIPKLKAGAWRKDPGVAKTMYGLYLRGSGDGKPMSLAEIGKAYGISRQAVYDTFHARGWPLRSKQKKGLTRAFGIDFTLDGYGRLRGTTKTGERVYLHRMIWEKANGPIPPRHQLHFKNGDKLDCRIENLELVRYEDLQKIFNPTGKNNMKKHWETRRKKARDERRAAREAEELELSTV